MTDTLERYQRFTYGSLDASQPAENQHSYHEYLRLKARVEILQRYHRNLLGEDLISLSTKELEQFEHQLEISLKHIRSTKTQFMLDQLEDLQKKEQELAEDNKVLKKKLDENAANISLRLRWEGREQAIPYHRFPSNTEPFFQPLGQNSTLHLGYNPAGSGEVNFNGLFPDFMR